MSLWYTDDDNDNENNSHYVEDWKNLPISEFVKYLYDHDTAETRRDVTFLVGPDRVPISAHKIIISTASRVFAKMLFNNYQNNDGAVVPTEVHVTKELANVDPDAFQVLLKVENFSWN